jgi:Ca-activated chloride channel family protein
MNSKIKLSLIIPLYLLIFFIPKVYATDQAIIIFDASGSMTGKLGDDVKINIARDVIGNFVTNWNEDIELGLMVYGHREKNNCDDIEMLQTVSPIDGKKIQESINTISPKGKTPISQSLKKAAEILRYTEDAATVFLISDGGENCHADPCVVAKELEEKGINFEANVISFNAKKNKIAHDQLKCIADNTGGTFYTAEDAKSLKEALIKMKKAAKKTPKSSKISLTALDSTTNQATTGATEWSIINVSTEAIQTLKSNNATLQADLVKGEYEIFVTVGDKTGEGKITVSDKPEQQLTITIGTTKSTKAFDAPASIAAGEVLTFNWNGPNSKRDMIFITKPNEPENRYYSGERRHRVKDGMPATLTAPATPGDYEIRYFSYGNGAVLKRAPLKVTKSNVSIETPAEVPAGNSFSITWTGPNSAKDIIFITKKDFDRRKYFGSNNRHLRTKDGASGKLTAPAEPGEYEIRYYSYNNGNVLASFPIKIIPAEVSLNAPRIASVGATLELKWTGPNAKGDLLFICKPDLAEGKYFYSGAQQSSTSDGSPAKFTVPAKAGTYEIRYYSKNNGKVLARRALIVRSSTAQTESESKETTEPESGGLGGLGDALNKKMKEMGGTISDLPSGIQ